MLLFIHKYHIDIEQINKILDLSAWIKKYLIEASRLYIFLLIKIMGINDNMLISRDTHKNIQLDLIIAIIIEIIDVIIIKKVKGYLNFIGAW